jgi:adenine phosphoribosyltransferase
MENKLSDLIRTIKNFPKEGVLYRDITTLLKEPRAFGQVVDLMYEYYHGKKIDKVACIESRGFILGSALAKSLSAGFIPIRKKGKLPGEVISNSYDLEYGTDVIEIHKDAIAEGENILLHDDLLATGGTMYAAVELVKRLKADIVGISFLVELKFLHGRDKLKGYNVFSLIEYDN